MITLFYTTSFASCADRQIQQNASFLSGLELTLFLFTIIKCLKQFLLFTFITVIAKGRMWIVGKGRLSPR